MFLSKSNFSNIVKSTPLVSIDLCILKGRHLLLGKRINPPAKDFFFVPGGRIFKSELINDALKRILKDELGFLLKDGYEIFLKNMGFYEHFYDDNFLENYEFGTHYVVIAFLVPFDSLINSQKQVLSDQHSVYIWFDKSNIKNNSKKIHKYTLEYFKNPLLKEF